MIPTAPEEPLLLGSRDELPRNVTEAFEQLREGSERLRIAVQSDMTLDGLFEDTWLLATERRLLVLAGGDGGGEATLVQGVLIEGIVSSTLKNYVGNGVLDGSDRTLRFSKNRLSAIGQ